MNDAKHFIKFGLLCDDIRREDNGKLIAIGIYGRDIVLTKIPGALILAALISVDDYEEGASKFEIAMELNEQVLNRASGEITFDGTGGSLVRVPRMACEFPEEGTFVLKARFEGNEWKELWKGQVKAGS
jgi:hypothetical protein